MSLHIKSLIRKFFERFFWRQHPESALRYLPVVDAIKKANLTHAKILEVGSGSLGITPYFKKNIDGADVDFTGPSSSYLHKIKGTADDLPFKKNSYDVSICVDTLEHLEKGKRQEAIYELLRVTKKLVILVMPVGQLAQDQDKKLYDYWRKIMGSPNQFFEEHLRYGLPSVDEILVFIDKSARKLKKEVKVKSSPSLNLFVRNILMKTWISKNKFLYYLYMKGYLLALPLLRLANFGNCYRRVFVIEFSS